MILFLGEGVGVLEGGGDGGTGGGGNFRTSVDPSGTTVLLVCYCSVF